MYPLNVSLPAPAIGFACANDEHEHQALTVAGYVPALVKAEPVAAPQGNEDQSTPLKPLEAPSGAATHASKADVMAALDDAGIDYDKRLGVEKLRALLP